MKLYKFASILHKNSSIRKYLELHDVHKLLYKILMESIYLIFAACACNWHKEWRMNGMLA